MYLYLNIFQIHKDTFSLPLVVIFTLTEHLVMTQSRLFTKI